MNRNELTLGDTLQGILDNSYGVKENDRMNSFTFDLPQNKVKVTRSVEGWSVGLVVEVDGAVVWSLLIEPKHLEDERVYLFFARAYEKFKEYQKIDKEMALNKFYNNF